MADETAYEIAELVAPLSGADWWNTPGAAGVPPLKVTDGPSGARGELFVGGPPSVWFPCGAALGASWDVVLAARVGAALAGETRAKGAHVLLAPTVNLQRDPLGGRHFECMSEDPVLTAHLAVAYIRALQEGGVAACVKHLVANDAEDDRFEVSSDVDERTLREVSLLPFEHALRAAHSWSVMSAYNRLNGTHCSENRWLLTEVLRGQWGWDGVVISDWFGTRSTVGAALGGLDLEMPGPAIHFGDALVKAIDSGDVDAAVIDTKLEHLCLLAERTDATSSPPAADGSGGADDVLAVARASAVGGTVLLRNEPVGGSRVLPLDVSAISRLAVIGPNADREVVGGGGSARLTPTAVTTVLDGLRAQVGGDRITYELGCHADRGTPGIDGRHARRADGTPGIDVEVLDGAGDVRVRLRPREFRVLVASEPWRGAASSEWSLRASCTYEPTRSGSHHLKLKTNCNAQLTVAGLAVIDTVSGSTEGDVELIEGTPVAIAVTGVPPADDQLFRVALELRCSPPTIDDAIERAVAAARAAEAAVVVIGLDGEWETEGRDRDDLALPGDQVALVRAVAAAQPRTAVVVLAGSPVDLSWADEVPALVWGWYPGQEGGHGLADVLLGVADPGGRLPCTMPARLADTLAVPPHERGAGHVAYEEGVLNGHRRYDREGIEPAFPFGFGLSYTTFAIGAPVPSTTTLGPGESFVVDVEVANTGSRAGSEVVQLYITDAEASVPRPDRELRAFAKVHLDPGERRKVALSVGPRDLAFWDTTGPSWRAEAGTFELHVGRSSRELTGSATVELRADWTVPASWWSDA